jgi:hypothetical protein
MALLDWLACAPVSAIVLFFLMAGVNEWRREW